MLNADKLTVKSGEALNAAIPLARQNGNPLVYDVHLLLAELYLDRGWRGQAADKLVLLCRLSRLTDDGATRTRLCELATARLPDDPRFIDLCA